MVLDVKGRIELPVVGKRASATVSGDPDSRLLQHDESAVFAKDQLLTWRRSVDEHLELKRVSWGLDQAAVRPADWRDRLVDWPDQAWPRVTKPRPKSSAGLRLTP
jgi:hypothetical protein